MKAQKLHHDNDLCRCLQCKTKGGFQIKDNRKKSIIQAKLFSIIQQQTYPRMNYLGVNHLVSSTLQRASSITCTPGTLTIGAVTAKVGKKMEAHLEKGDALQGSEASNDTKQNLLMNEIYKNDSPVRTPNPTCNTSYNRYIKGHLLNHDLGGPGWALNLYPITNDANSNHSTYVEEPVKRLLRNYSVLDYTVEVQNESIVDGLPQADFSCSVSCDSIPLTTCTISSSSGNNSVSGTDIKDLAPSGDGKLAVWKHKDNLNEHFTDKLLGKMTINGGIPCDKHSLRTNGYID